MRNDLLIIGLFLRIQNKEVCHLKESFVFHHIGEKRRPAGLGYFLLINIPRPSAEDYPISLAGVCVRSPDRPRPTGAAGSSSSLQLTQFQPGSLPSHYTEPLQTEQAYSMLSYLVRDPRLGCQRCSHRLVTKSVNGHNNKENRCNVSQ